LPSDPGRHRAFETEANRGRRRRAAALAANLGATPTQVAVAWVLHQPFPTFPIVGPRTVAELREAVEAVELELEPDEVRWLDLGPGRQLTVDRLV
jgi:aryl-alcohol dehydrogenase-like predicted oxidoreductase